MIHTFALNNMYFAVDGNSGSIHMLDELSFRLLSEMQELVPLESVIGIIRDKEKNGASFSGNPDVKPIAAYSYEEIEEAYNEIKELKEQGLLSNLELKAVS